MSDSVYELAREDPSSKSMLSRRDSVGTKHSSIMSCSICLSKILNPALLTCGHKFCEGCLQKYWDSTDRPVFIICPLCRANVFNVDFSQKQGPSSDDFRKTFRNYLDNMVETEDLACTSMTCLKISIILPAVYYLLKWLGVPFMHLLLHRHKI